MKKTLITLAALAFASATASAVCDKDDMTFFGEDAGEAGMTFKHVLEPDTSWTISGKVTMGNGHVSGTHGFTDTQLPNADEHTLAWGGEKHYGQYTKVIQLGNDFTLGQGLALVLIDNNDGTDTASAALTMIAQAADGSNQREWTFVFSGYTDIAVGQELTFVINYYGDWGTPEIAVTLNREGSDESIIELSTAGGAALQPITSATTDISSPEGVAYGWKPGDLKIIHDLNAPLVVPEPTTATLSLLALAGLAGRRRRK